MASTAKAIRSAVSGNIPTTAQLELGQVAINTYDGRMYIKKSDGGSPATEEVILVNTVAAGGVTIVQEVAGNILPLSGTTEIPFDDTAPLVTEGTEFGAGIITPSSALNHMTITWSIILEGTQTNQTIIVSVFRNDICIGAIPIASSFGNRPAPLSWTIVDEPATTNPVTYSGRIGITNGTWKVNQPDDGNLGSKVEAASYYIIREHQVGA